MMTARTAIPLLILAASACSWGEPDRPVIHAVSPERLTRGSAGVLRVTGAFAPEVVVDFDEPGGSPVCTAVRVELRAAGEATVALAEAQAVSGTEIRARIPDGLMDALWDVAVVDAAGRAAVLQGAFTVTSCSITPNAPCHDGNPCTHDADIVAPESGLEDQCVGVAFCGGPDHVADGTPCVLECTDGGGGVAGACSDGTCVPTTARCEPPHACDTP